MNPKSRRNKLAEIRLVADSLRSEPIDAPDFTASILSRVDAERAFLAPSVRRTIPWVRLGLLGGVSMLALSAALVLRYAPASADLVERPAPLAAVVRTFKQQADAPLESFRQSVRQTVEETVQSVALAEPSRVLSAAAAAARLPEPAAVVRLSPATFHAEPAPPTSLAGGAGEPVFVGLAAAAPAAPRAENLLLAERPGVPALSVVASARPLLSAETFLGPRLESSVVPPPRSAAFPALLDSGLDERPIVK